MAEQSPNVTECIEQIVREARIPSRRRREELRRELWSHFDEHERRGAGTTAALSRFGAMAEVAASFRQVYRGDYLLWYWLKLASAVAGSAALALLIQLAVHLRPGRQLTGWSLDPGFARTALVSVAVALGAVAVWESLRRPFEWWRLAVAAALYALASWGVEAVFGRGGETFIAALVLVVVAAATSRLALGLPRLALVYLGFFAIMYGAHQLAQAAGIGLGRSLAVSAGLLAVWVASLGVLSRVDRAFQTLLHQP